MKRIQRLGALLCILLMLLPALALAEGSILLSAADYPVTRDGWYSTMEEVAVYIASYRRLPGNYLTKNQAARLGWSSSAGNLGQVAPGQSIGGDRFGNYEGLLPDRRGRSWTECDIDFTGGYRNGKRIVYSNDGLIYYTANHYSTFTQVEVSFSAPAPTASPTPRATAAPTPAPTATVRAEVFVQEDGLYTGKEEVAAYLHAFWGLPANYVTKEEARTMGWSSKKNNLNEVLPGYTIGGDEFGNREGLLPATGTRTWYECDVNTTDGSRSRERLVYSSDGLIYYTNDGFKTFEQLYDQEGML